MNTVVDLCQVVIDLTNQQILTFLTQIKRKVN